MLSKGEEDPWDAVDNDFDEGKIFNKQFYLHRSSDKRDLLSRTVVW